MRNRINIGVLSTANIGVRSVIPTIQSLSERFNLMGIASRDIEKAKSIADKFKTAAFGKYDELLSDSELNAVYIPLPNALHAGWIEKALNRNLHVLSEKSLGCSLLEVEKLTKLAREKGMVLLENFQFRKHRQLDTLLDILDSKEIGEIRSVRAQFGFPPLPDVENIRYKKGLGGGALLDAGAYTIKVSQILIKDDLKVSGASAYHDQQKGVDIWGNGFLAGINSPLSSHISFGFDQYYQCGVEIWGSKGKCYTNRIFTARKDFAPMIYIETEKGKQTIKVEPDDHFKNMLSHFHRLITRNDKAAIEQEHRQNLTQARLVEEFREAAYEK